MAEPPFRWRLPYRQLALEDPLRPLVPVQIRYGDALVNARGLVDSGADRSLFSAGLAPALGIDLSHLPAPRVGSARGVGGAESVVAVDVQMSVVGVRFSARIHFSSAWSTEFGLLGRADFFRAFRVAFDERAETFFFDPYNAATDP